MFGSEMKKKQFRLFKKHSQRSTNIRQKSQKDPISFDWKWGVILAVFLVLLAFYMKNIINCM